MTEDEELHIRNLKAEYAYKEVAERETEMFEVTIEDGDISITYNDYSKNSMTTEELRKMIGHPE